MRFILKRKLLEIVIESMESSGETVVAVDERKSSRDTPKKTKSIISRSSAKWRHIAAEFLSTAILVLMGCMTYVPFEGQSYIYSAFGFGLVVMFNEQIFGHVSGAHMNPSVTVAAMLLGYTSVVLGCAYIFAQCVGAIAGYAILMGLAPLDIASDGVCAAGSAPGVTPIQTVGYEIVITTILVLVCCIFLDPEKKYKDAPVVIGLTVTGLSLAAAPWTGAGMNPAVSLGPAVFTGIWTIHWAYWVGPFIGSCFAAFIYKFIVKPR